MFDLYFGCQETFSGLLSGFRCGWSVWGCQNDTAQALGGKQDGVTLVDMRAPNKKQTKKTIALMQ